MTDAHAEAGAIARLTAVEHSGEKRVLLSHPLTMLVETTLVACVWLLMFPLRRAAAPGLSWEGQLALALAPASVWVILVGRRAPAWWVRRGGPVRIVRSRLWPVAAVATAPALPAMFARSFELPGLPVLFLFGVASAAVLTLTALGFRPGPTAPVETGSGPSKLAEKALAVGGLCCAVSLSGFDRQSGLDRFWTQWFLELLRDGLRWAGVIGVCVFLSAGADRFPRCGLALCLCYRRLRARNVLVACCTLSVLLAGLFAAYALDRTPHLQDEIAMIFQARNLAAGRLYAPAPPLPQFFDMEFVVVDGDRWYGKYQLGPALWYLPGVLLNCVWLVSPAISIAAIVLLFFLAREILGPDWSKGAVLLAVVSPWWIMTHASMMAHPGCLLMLSGFALFFLRAAKQPGRWVDALVSGVFLGAAVHFRPYTALLIAAVMVLSAVAASWWRHLRAGPAIAFLVPVLGSLALAFAYNQALTGDPRVTPFEEWSSHDRLGFGPDRGMYRETLRGFRPAQGVENIRLQFQALGTSCMGWPAATLVLPLAALVFGTTRKRCCLLILAPLALIAGYFFYHYGWPVYYGVRYWSEALPAFLLLILVGLELLRRAVRGGLRLAGIRAASIRSRAFIAWMVVLLLAGNAIGYAPSLISEYREGVWWASCSAAQDAVREQQLRNAVVFMDTAHYRRNRYSEDWYGAGFHTLSPDLHDEVLFVRDLGDEQNRKLMEVYPEREYYRMSRYGPRLATIRPYSLTDSAAAPAASSAPPR